MAGNGWGGWLLRAALLYAGFSGAFGDAARAQGASSPEAKSFIVTCDCKTPAQRERIAAEVRKRGGKVLYIYSEIHGLAVAAPRRGSAKRFAASIEHIRGVIAVQPDGVSQTSTVN
ncbi:hypothetical protein [Aureimonas sp. AU40]|uniref:hypothetical protein n=1 Tax=Aureimonas sp. AU40 TaxID=1637747 RepID=UPI00078220D8|nr:hypothetical protein [Aureimonas sp. AU40]